MVAQDEPSVIVPVVTVYDVRQDEEVVFRDVHVDAHHAKDSEGRAMYFSIDEADSHLRERGKSLASLPLLVNLYITLNALAAENEAASQVFAQLNTTWDRTGTTISPTGRIVHSDSIVGQITHEGLAVPREGNSIASLYEANQKFFQALLGVRDLTKLIDVTSKNDQVPFYWYPRGERRAMFGGGDFYYMHQHLRGLLMVFCDDEPHPRRVLRAVWQER